MQPAFRSALLPRPQFQCLGCELQPLQLGHLFLLRSVASPLLEPGEAIERADLLLAVAVCSQSWREAQRALEQPWRMIPRMTLMGLRKLGKNQSASELVTFLQYLNHERTGPTAAKPREGRALQTPLEWRLYDELTSRGYTHDAALDSLVKRAQCLWAARNEAAGNIQLTDTSIISRLWAKSHSATV